MSIHHDVTIHCDTCGLWEHGDSRTTRQRRNAGWSIWPDDRGKWCHKCPTCNTQSTEQDLL